MKVYLPQRQFRRAALSLLAAAFGFSPVPALALMPWSGEGHCSALVAHGVGAWPCDFRDYRSTAAAQVDYASLAASPAHSLGIREAEDLIAESAECDLAPDAAIDEAEAVAKAEPLHYDWRTASVCGPTDWERMGTAEAAPSVGRAIQIVLELCPVCPLAPVDWEPLREFAHLLAQPPSLAAHQVASAQRATTAGARVAVRTAAGQLSGMLSAVGRQCLGAAAALDRVATDEPAIEHGTPSATTRTWLPQPCMEPYGHLGL